MKWGLIVGGFLALGLVSIVAQLIPPAPQHTDAWQVLDCTATPLAVSGTGPSITWAGNLMTMHGCFQHPLRTLTIRDERSGTVYSLTPMNQTSTSVQFLWPAGIPATTSLTAEQLLMASKQ